MLGTFLGLQTSLRGLETAQAGISTVSHNIDNANTPGYSRERIDLTEEQAIDMPGLTSAMAGQVGQGVKVVQVQRLRSSFLDEQYRGQNAGLGQANVEQDTLNKISGIIDEPSDTGISNAMQQFFQAWDTLGSNPNTLSARTSVINAAQSLTDVMNQTANQLSELNGNVQASMGDAVTQVNTLLQQVANVSNQIARVQQTGNQPNDLMDQRDELLDQLSQYTNFQTSITPVKTGDISYDQFSLTLTGTNSGTSTTSNVTVIDGSKTDFTNANPPANFVNQLFVASDTGSIKIVPQGTTSLTPAATVDGYPDLSGQGGELQGYQTSLSDVQNYQDQLDVLAQSLAGSGTTTLGAGWTIPASEVSNPPYSGMSVDDGSGPQSISSYVSSLVETNGTYTVPSGTKVSTSLGNMTVSLLGDLDLTAQNTASPAFDNVMVQTSTGPKALSSFAPGTTLSAGTTITVGGINQLLQIGFSENGQGSPLFGIPSSANGQPITAANITVTAQASDLAAGTKSDGGTPPKGLTGDGTLATLMGNLKDVQLSFPSPSSNSSSSGTQLTGTFSDYLTSVVGELGIQGQSANNTVNVQQSLVQQLDTQRQSVSGVSIDEEMASMISYQQAYNASSKVIQTINDMLSALMNEKQS